MATTTGAVDTTNPQQLKEARFTEDFEDDGHANGNDTHNTLKKNDSIGRKMSLRKSGSKRVPQKDYSQQFAEQSNDPNSALVSPIPTQVNPTEILATRFNNWRRVLKEFSTFFKEIASQYETRAKSFSRVQSCLNTTLHGDTFLSPNGGLAQTHKLLSSFHNDQRVAAENARQIELQIVTQLNAVRNDLAQKVKEIKSLSSDFKNNVDKEKEATRKAIIGYLDALSAFSSNSEVASKQDPFLVKLSVERQVRKLLSEENYLHRAYLNIESSGRELESIVVQEIQKAFRTYGEIVKNEGVTNVNFNTSLETVLLQMPPDREWTEFISKDSNFVSPDSPLRTLDMIHYPGHDSPATTEIRSGPLERKSKYLKSFSPGWFLLSPTHLHEFKTSDRSTDLTPVMSLYLPDCTIGDHSNPHAVNHKFMLKGKKTGALHRGHTWVFRAASHDAMMEWYEDIRKLTELSGPARDNFVGRRRTLSISQKQSPVTVDNIDEDDEEDRKLMADEDDVPYSVTSFNSALTPEPQYEELAPPKRPEAGRFGSSLSLTPNARYSNSSEEAIAGVHGLPGGAVGYADNRPSSRGSSTWSYNEKNQQYSNSVTQRDAFSPMDTNVAPGAERDSGNFDNSGPIPPNTLRKQPSGTFIHEAPAQPTASFGTENIDQYILNKAPDQSTAPSSTRNNINVPAAVFVPGKTASQVEPTPTVGGYDDISPAPISQDSYHPPAPVAQDSYHPITAGAGPGQSQLGMNGGEGDVINPIDAGPLSPQRPPKTPVPGTTQSTLENIHFPGEYPRQQ